MPPRPEERVAFEFDGFRVDPVRRVLTRDGEPVPITPKAMSILLALLAKPGEVVEKKELLDKIWPGVFVTEANLTQNVFSLRKCLGERANDNRYIVTVPGQGYLFGGDVRRVERFQTGEFPIVRLDEPPAVPAQVPQTPQIPQIPQTSTAETPTVLEIPAPAMTLPAMPPMIPAPVPAAPPQKTPSILFRSLSVGGVLLVLFALGAAFFGLLFHSSTTKSRTSGIGLGSRVRPAIAVLDFKSLSPDDSTRWLQTAFAEMLTTELAAGGSLRVVRGETVAEALKSLDIDDPSRLGPLELERLHDVLGVDLVVVGSYVPIGGKLRLDLRVLEAPEGDTVVSLARTGPQAGIFDLVSNTGREVRDKLGIAALSPRQIQETLALRPSSTEASRLYSLGLERLRDFDPPGALKYLQQAAAEDPDSAVIHSALSQAWSSLGYDAQTEEEARKAVDLSRSLSREDRLAIEGRLYRARKDLEKASQTYRTLITFFPDDVEYGLQLAECLMLGGRVTEAAATLASLHKLPPPAGEDPRVDLLEARNARRMNDPVTEKRAADAAAAKSRRSGQTLILAQALIYQGDALMMTGHPQESLPLLRESKALAEKAGYQWGMGMALANLGRAFQMLGDLEAAQAAQEQSLVIAQRLGSAIGITAQLYGLGELHRERGRLTEALSFLEQAHTWLVKMGDRYMEVEVLNSAGTVLLARGDLVGARRRFEQALTLSQTLSNRAKEGLALANLATVLAYQGELQEARRRHAEAFTLLSRSGDPSAAASALAASADAGARLGELRAAWQQSAQALEAKRQTGDRLGIGRILGSRSWLAYQMGDLTASRSLAEEQHRIAQQTGARSLTAWALQNLGRADFAAGNLAAARAELEEAQQVSSAQGEELRSMEVRLDLARLALAANQPSEAALLARETAAWYRARGIPGGRIRAQALLAESLLHQGLEGEARQAAAEVRAQITASEDRELRAMAAVSLARFEAAAGNPNEAVRLLQHASEDVSRTGFAAASLEVRLALGEIQRGLGDASAVATLAAVRRDAEALGFKRVAVSAGLRQPPAVARAPVRG